MPNLILSTLLAFLLALSSGASALETVTLQLKWKHQFQFAGYYAAREKGFYQEAGLNVVIREANQDLDPVETVLSGKANYAVGTSELLLDHHRGEPVVVLAVIFQHSPLAIMMLKNEDQQQLHQILGKTIMIEPHSAELFAYLESEGLSKGDFNIIPHSFNIQDIIDKNVTAMSVYTTDEPYALQQAGIEYVLYTPQMGGIDFYGDNLFTSQDELKNAFSRTMAFRNASLKGWKYAMENPEEIIQLIYNRYSQRHSLEHLRFEANKMRALLQINLVEPGYMNEGRWRHIAQVYQSQNKLPDNFLLDDFLYQPAKKIDLAVLKYWIFVSTIIVLIISTIAILIFRLNKNLRASQSWLSTIIENAPNALIIVDSDGIISQWNRHAESTFGWKAEEIIGKNAYQFLVQKNDIDSVKSQLNGVFIEHRPFQGKAWNLTKTGTHILCQWNNAFIAKDKHGKSYMVSMAIDITKQKMLEDKLKLRALTDPLTGAANRSLFYIKFKQSIKQAKRHKKLLAVLFIDLDNFKNINDRYGHEAGDTVLKAIVSRLKSNSRDIDLVARLGGDEFVLLLYDCNNRSNAEKVAEKIIEAVIKPIKINEMRLVAVSASIGISLYPEHGTEPDELLKTADLAMYSVKQGSKNNIFVAK